jgi:hypothetical protein
MAGESKPRKVHKLRLYALTFDWGTNHCCVATLCPTGYHHGTKVSDIWKRVTCKKCLKLRKGK